MKNIFFIFSIVFVLLTVGCKTEKTSSNNYSDELNSIVLSQNKIVRNLNFGDTRSQIKEVEAQQKVIAQDATRLAFEVNLANEEFADVNYTLKKDEIEMINIDIYKNSLSSANSLFQEFISYYTEKVGKPKASAADEVSWINDDKNYSVLLLLYSTEEDPGLELQYAPID